MGTVYEAMHVEIGKRVAIKVLATMFDQHDEASARFLREARVASAVESEHIVHVFDIGEDLQAGLYMVMELLPGEDLARALASRGRLRGEEAAGIVFQVCLALERAHRAGVVHRDLKPGNVFLSRTDDGSIKVKVLDFGIAKLVREAREAKGRAITKRGTAVGTPQYMAPEQAQGLASVDTRADVYSLGALLYECITGAPPYPDLGSYEQTIVRILTTAPPPIEDAAPDVHPDLAALVRVMMDRAPEDRPATSEVRAQIEAAFPETAARRLLMGAIPAATTSRPPPAERTGSGVTVESEDPARLAAARSLPVRSIAVGAAVGLVILALTILSLRSPAPPPVAAHVPERAAVAASPPREAPSVATVTGAPVAAPPPTPGAIPTVTWDSLPRAAPSAAAAASVAARYAGAAPATDIASLVGQARVLLGTDARRAERLALSATRLDATRADAWLVLGRAEEALGQRAAALRAYASCSQHGAGPDVEECRKRLVRE
jgi:serine/threonine-protein kinase